MKIKMKGIRLLLIALVGFLLVLSAGWMLLARLEGGKPAIALDLPAAAVGASQEVSVTVSDSQSGLRRIWIGALKDGREVVLLEKDFPSVGLFGGEKVYQESYKVMIEPRKAGITDGKALLRMAAWDYSWRDWGHGNKTYVEKEIVIDTQPPQINMLSKAHNITEGGAGIVIYTVSEPCQSSGVYVGENFFPGHSGHFKDPNIFLAFIALDYTQGPGTEIYVKVTDYAGNSARAGFPYYIRKKVFKQDLINISDRFLNWKMPEFDPEIPQGSQMTLIEKFLLVNRDLRQTNFRKISSVSEKTENVLYWEGAFLRFPNSERKAGYADHRDYQYQGRLVDRQVHLGIDLASLEQSSVPAANKGKIAFSGSIGIYGKTVIIDHGFGLFSMYSHLSDFAVQEGQMISKGETIGRTGSTGLAAGDHLHFAMLVHHTFVNPVEWWDAAWIENNISTKINSASSR